MQQIKTRFFALPFRKTEQTQKTQLSPTDLVFIGIGVYNTFYKHNISTVYGKLYDRFK